MAFERHDVVIDSPINNFATLSPIASHINAVTTDQLENGNLICHTRGVSGVTVNMGISSMYFPREGKWYFEILLRDGSDPHMWSGIQNESHTRYVTYYFDKIYYQDSSGNLTYTTISNSTSVRGVHGFLVDFDTGSFTTYHNGTANNPVSFNHFNDENFYIYIDDGSSNHQTSQVLNAGQDPTFNGDPYLAAGAGSFTPDNGIGSFAFLPVDSSGNPITDFKALCTKNLPEGPIKLSEDHTPSDNFKAVIYDGTGADGNPVEVGFPSDLIWIKDREFGSQFVLIDSVRGYNRELFSSMTKEEQNDANRGGSYKSALSEINATGFVLNSNVGPTGSTNSPYKHIAWVWRAAGSPASGEAKFINQDGSGTGTMTTAELKTNTGASIEPSKVSANRPSGFSIITANFASSTTTSTLPHGLSKAPEFIMMKSLDLGYNWSVYHKHLGPNNRMKLNTIDGPENAIQAWGGMLPTDELIYIGNQSWHGAGGQVLYAFHSVEGYSKIGHTYAESSADGAYIHCGFRPSFVLWRNLNSSRGWFIVDSSRSPYNPIQLSLDVQATSPEGSYGYGDLMDFTASGFKIRNTTTPNFAESGSGFIFMAFSEQPFSAPANAR